MKSFTFIVKPVSTGCNFSCKYCYHGQLRDSQKANCRMDLSTMRLLFEQLSKLEQDTVKIIWHGGEPLLAGKEFYHQVLQEQEKFPGKFVNLIQTNGALIDNDWVNIFKEGRFRIGVSLDGPVALNDQQRIYSSGKGTYNVIKRGICQLIDNGLEVGTVSVITQSNINHCSEVFGFLHDLGIRHMNFSPCVDLGESYSINGRQFGEFLSNLFDLWIQLDDPAIKIVPLSSILECLLGSKPTVCYFMPDCSNFLSVDYDGAIYVCGRSVGDSKRKIGYVGSGINAAIDSRAYAEIIGGITTLHHECGTCSFFNVCGGGCCLERDREGKFILCDAMKIVVPHIQKLISDSE